MKKAFLLTLFISLFALDISAREIYTQSLFDRVQNRYGQATLNRFLLLKDIILNNKNSSELEKLKVVNSFFNKVTYASDKSVWSRSDYWATPFEFLVKDKGDSEDFVFAKYFTLVKELGISSDKFFFTYVKSIKKNASYMVLAYYETKKSMPLILDSLNFRVLPASKRRDIAPIYSFSEQNRVVGGKLSARFKSQQTSKLKGLLENTRRGKI